MWFANLDGAKKISRWKSRSRYSYFTQKWELLKRQAERRGKALHLSPETKIRQAMFLPLSKNLKALNCCLSFDETHPVSLSKPW